MYVECVPSCYSKFLTQLEIPCLGDYRNMVQNSNQGVKVARCQRMSIPSTSIDDIQTDPPKTPSHHLKSSKMGQL